MYTARPRPLGLLAGLLLLTVPVLRATASDSSGGALLAADSARNAALVSADAAALERVFADELSYVHSTGVTMGKAAMLGALGSHRIRYVAITTGDVAVRDYGCTGVVTAAATLNVEAGERPASIQVRYTATYVRRDERWQLVAYQSTAVRPLAP